MALSRPNQTAAIAKVQGSTPFPAAATYAWTDGFTTPVAPFTTAPPLHVAAGHYRLTLDTPLGYTGAAAAKPGNAVIITCDGANPIVATYVIVDAVTIDVFTWTPGVTPSPEDADFWIRVEVSPTERQ
jgi:hypothetical protein